MQLVAKLARIRIGNDVFKSGDGILLPQISVSLGEGDRSSTCQFSVNDPGLKIGAKYREISITQGGIQVPRELLGDTPATGTGTQGQTPSTNTLGNADSNVPLSIVRECLRQGVTDPTKIAFILAVAEGETNFRYDAFNPETNNPNVPDKRYGGRGLAQITQAYNYEYFGNLLGVDLLGNPDLAFRPDISVYILVAGIKRGWCSRGGLDRWITGPDSSISRAYRNIQGGVWGDRYQRFFNKWLQQVQALITQAGGAAAATPTPTPPADPMATETEAPQTTPAQTVPPVVESSQKGTEIIIELAVGYGATFKDAVAFHFIHVSTQTEWDGSGTQITTFGGQCVRWLLTCVPVTESFEGITFRQYLENRCRSFGLQLEMEGDGLRYQHLSQDGQTHLQTILREARRIGFSIREGTGPRSGTLIVEPEARPIFTNFVIDEEVLIKPARFTDKARESTSGAPGATVSNPGTGTGQATYAIARDSGSITQVAPESQAGTGNAPNATGNTTGATAPPVGGTVQPSTSSTPAPTPSATPAPVAAGQTSNESKTEEPTRTTRADGTVVVTTRITETKTEPGKITTTTETRTITTPTSGTPTAQTRIEERIATDEGVAIKITIQVIGQPDQVSTKQEELTAEDKRLLELSKRTPPPATTAAPGNGLPNQPAGVIDLADGRAEAQAIADESRRIKGYEDSAVLVMNSDTLQIVPGQIVALSKRLFPDAFATEKRVGKVEHNFAEGTVAIDFYTPQAPPPNTGAPSTAPTGASAAVPGKLQNPLPGALRGTPYDPSGVIRGRGHYGIDQAGGPNHDILAAEAGQVSFAGVKGGYGNTVIISHTGAWQGWETLYAHLRSISVSAGQTVARGQKVGVEGTTGASRGVHLHFETKRNGSRVDPELYIAPPPTGVYGQGVGYPIRSR